MYIFCVRFCTLYNKHESLKQHTSCSYNVQSVLYIVQFLNENSLLFVHCTIFCCQFCVLCIVIHRTHLIASRNCTFFWCQKSTFSLKSGVSARTGAGWSVNNDTHRLQESGSRTTAAWPKACNKDRHTNSFSCRQGNNHWVNLSTTRTTVVFV